MSCISAVILHFHLGNDTGDIGKQSVVTVATRSQGHKQAKFLKLASKLVQTWHDVRQGKEGLYLQNTATEFGPKGLPLNEPPTSLSFLVITV